MRHPLSKDYSDKDSKDLVQKAISGDKEALNDLIKVHQPFIYNVAWKMCHDPTDADDLTQEVLIKIITKLAQFSFKSSFRTWLYRIVVNEFLQSKRRQGETQFSSFEDYGDRLDAVPNAELTIEEELSQIELSNEMKIRCMSGMIMCLDREQRLLFILGESFGIDHNLGAEIFDISPQNFRVKLHRARTDLYNYMNNKCGLVNTANPCRCPKKAKTLKKMGMLSEDSLAFNIKTKVRIGDFAVENHEKALDDFTDTYTSLFRSHPAQDSFDKKTVLEKLVNNDDLMKYFNP